jgi:hypothetical protein
MKAVPWWCALVVGSVLTVGCQDSKTDAPQASATAQPPAPDTVAAKPDEEDTIRASLAKLPPEDRKLAEEQRFCAVMNQNRLGSMGTPVKVVLQDQTVFLCCKGCSKKAQNNPEKTLAKAKELRAKHAASPETGAQAPAGKVTLSRVPGQGIQPQVAVDGKGTVHLIYFAGEANGGDIFYVRSEGGEHFSPPLRVNSRAGSAIAIGNIRGAHLAVGKNGRLHIAWMGSAKSEPRAPGNATPMLYARLNDAGTAFEPERNVIQSAVGLDGGGSVAADGAGNVYVVWHAPEPNTKGEASRCVWVARSTDEGKTFAREERATTEPTGACGCCGMRAFADAQGGVYVLYRSATDGIHRDMYLLASSNRGAGFQYQKVGPWEISGCPMSTAAFGESAGTVFAAWETDGQVYYTRIDSKTGERSAPVAAPGAGKGRKHPVVAGNRAGETILVWTEGMGWNRGGSLVWQVFDKAGKPTEDKGQVGGVPVWSLAAVFPRLNGGFTIIY